ncbi:5-carboxymethyl-2-hydroxymuconate Delta-isomerase [Falsibacillus pallidus]|uniref:5-carboxymethyl-2-hydroxymuconate delta isomerase n=1 Tax=Falsibacillus pallidus TaxID=493781 RepID=A0A370GZ67_9BACI|nr:5-carboxymethyl-2-hydroxymuconate Delta-isomerase [Falsibacillus pallidus]RDI47944.1 5-carboxymethyl-2-hydroxymuconate delta isomerase [Falsibacillus pallidus]
MPHFILEYTDNLKEEGNIPELLAKVNACLMERGDLFPIGGIRSRAIELKDYRIADGKEDDAFVHGMLKIGMGRTKEEKQSVGYELFRIMKEHFAALYEKRYLALSFEIAEFTNGTYKQNNIHRRFK